MRGLPEHQGHAGETAGGGPGMTTLAQVPVLFPRARVKRVMRSDRDVKHIRPDAITVTSKATVRTRPCAACL